MVILDVVDHNELFNSLKNPPIIVNDYDIDTVEDKKNLNDQIYTSYSDDSLEILPSCDCGYLKGEYNVGQVCPKCNTECLSVVERPLESILWIAPPEGVATLVNPEVWWIMAKYHTVSGVNLIEWLCNPTWQPKTDKIPPQLTRLKELGIPRGINFFYENFDQIFQTLIDNKMVFGSNQRVRDMYVAFIRANRHKLFSTYIPIPSKLIFIIEKAPTGVYADTSMTVAIDAIRTVTGVDASMSINKRQALAVKAVQKLADYYYTFFKDKLGSKEGWFRKHVFGSRLHFSFRAVISSLSEQHTYDELHLPWSMSVLFLKVHLTSKLLKRGFTPNEAIRFLYENTLQYNPLLDELFQELINEAPGGGIPVILQRNPTLTRLSAQRLRVTKIKKDVDINTVSLSVLILAGMNADFDGRIVHCRRKTSLIAGNS